ncbi:YchF/TatD family DNA exonuclease [Corallincola luteus]|uniref:YchF/TatD family DNA exonuclease n=1 Tax=Corallincola luteus TaxID=1775177 RepID=A0ABY2AIJ6_9GAMM|nr:YchF/TatD family DNA exonuclease [Corallincola luteus]TCI02508.1 YchF/TatD family DNA exonuclease [Corallincola luteus]
MLVDSHCHLDKLKLDEFDGDLAKVISAAKAQSVEHMLCVGIRLETFPEMLRQVTGFPEVSVSCGVHPLDQDSIWQQSKLLELASDPAVVAIGETGLDYFYAAESKEKQKLAFAGHLEVANTLKKPVIIHTRDAKEDTLAIMRAGDAEQVGGVLHCFTESWEMAKAALDMGFYISISGIVTFRNASALREVVKQVPLERLLVETDSPYLAPVPHRGRQNQPAYVRDVAEFVADLKGVSFQQLACATTDNFYRLFSQINRG